MNAEVTFSYRLSGVRSMQNHYRELAELIGEESDENMIGRAYLLCFPFHINTTNFT